MTQTAQEHARIADDIEAAAYRDMYAAAPAELVATLSLQSKQVGGATLLMAKGIPDPVFARAICLGNDGHADAALIDGIAVTFRDAGIAGYWVHVNPVLAPRELTSLLETRGFALAKRRTWAKMLRGTAALPKIDTPLAVRVATVAERVATSSAIAAAFGMPPPFALWIQNMCTRSTWTMMTVLDGDRTVGGGLLYIEGRHAWLGLGGVIPEARRRNAHRANMAARIAHAMERGCTHIVTETGEPINNEPNPSLRNMYRLGFAHVASRLNYVAS